MQELVGTLTRRLAGLDTASGNWLQGDADADRQLDTDPNVNWEQWHASIARIDIAQVQFFDALEGFLSAWARLSLLFFPTSNGRLARERARALKDQLGVPDNSPLSDRRLRDSWMHFDERMDTMIEAGIFQDRQRFVHARQAPDFIGHVPRLMEVDT